MKQLPHRICTLPLLSWWKGRRAAWLSGLLAATLLAVGGISLQDAGQDRATVSHTDAIPAAEFSRLIQEFSEKGGYFFADNFTSNESAYLYIMKPLKEYGSTGGAYVGVGPEQNFTYIAHIHPEIAFIVDIRREAVVQHLMYKAIFHVAPDPAHFLSILLSKPLVGSDVPSADTPIEETLKYFAKTPTSEPAYRSNLARLEKVIRKDFQFPLTDSDRRDLAYVYSAFYRGELMISFRMPGTYYGGYRRARFPNLADLILATDQDGKTGNFLAHRRDYEFVRELQEKNRIIPVVGDFGGTKALAAVAGYLRRNGYTLSAFYTSNVEQYLFGSGTFAKFVANVRKMPRNTKSLIIRSARMRSRIQPGYVPGHRMSPLLEFISVFLKDYDDGLYPDYWSLITTHYISGLEP